MKRLPKRSAIFAVCCVLLRLCACQLQPAPELVHHPASDVLAVPRVSAATPAPLLSQYLAQTDAVLQSHRALSGGAYLLCFLEEDGRYRVEATTLACGRTSYLYSDGAVQMDAEGFWALQSAPEGEAAAMECNGVRYAALTTYRPSLQLQAEADISMLGAVDAFAVATQAGAIYTAVQSDEGVTIQQLTLRAEAPQTLCTLSQAESDTELKRITQMHVQGDCLLFLGEAEAAGNARACFGSIALRRGTFALHLAPAGCHYTMAAYDDGAYFCLGDAETDVIYRVADGRETLLTLPSPVMLPQLFASQSGAQFAICTTERAETCITVYDAAGHRVTGSEQMGTVSQLYFDEGLRRVLFSVEGGVADQATWREILY